MEITIEQVTPWKRALDAARWTVNKPPTSADSPSDQWIEKMLIAEHSPIRLVEYDIKLKDIPNKVMGHLVRHHEGVEKFAGTHREDRTGGSDLEVNRLTPTDLWYSANAQGIINTSYKRLCRCAEKDTRETWEAVKEKMYEVDPLLADKMVPQCVRLGFCPELKCCGYINSKAYQEERTKYVPEDKLPKLNKE